MQQIIGGRLFDKPNPWDSKRISSIVKKEGDYFNLIHNDASFKPTFLFSESTLPDLGIDDIIDSNKYIRVYI